MTLFSIAFQQYAIIPLLILTFRQVCGDLGLQTLTTLLVHCSVFGMMYKLRSTYITLRDSAGHRIADLDCEQFQEVMNFMQNGDGGETLRAYFIRTEAEQSRRTLVDM